MDINAIISSYTNGEYTLEKYQAELASGLVENADKLVRAIVNEFIEDKRYNNPFAQFMLKRPSSGKIVNRSYVNPVTGVTTTVNDLTRLFDIAPADVKNSITKHTVTRSYDVTYSKDELRKAFVGEENLISFIGNLIGSLYNGSEIEDKENFLQLFKDMYNNNQCKIITVSAVTKSTVEDFAIKLKELVADFKEPSAKNNVWKRINPTDTAAVFWSNPGDINIIVSNATSAIMDVAFFAKLFNVDRAEIEGRLFTTNADNLPSGVEAILFDSRLVNIDELYSELEATFYDPTTRRSKEVYNTGREYGINPFANCVVLATSVPSVSAETVRNQTVKVTSGVEKVVPLTVTPVGANATITAVPGKETTTASVTYSSETGYSLSVTATADDTITFTGITGTVTVDVA